MPRPAYSPDPALQLETVAVVAHLTTRPATGLSDRDPDGARPIGETMASGIADEFGDDQPDAPRSAGLQPDLFGVDEKPHALGGERSLGHRSADIADVISEVGKTAGGRRK